MSAVVEYSKRKKELEYVDRTIRSAIAGISDSEWQINLFYSLEECARFVGENDLIDLFCVDVSESIAISMAELFRQKNRDALILILADTAVSPALYMKPGIMAAALLLFPLQKDAVQQTIGELFRYFAERSGDGNAQMFVIKSKTQHEHVPYSKIQYFESRDKKLFLNTLKKEYGFYETIDGVLEQLPDYFIRCHRSYVVNARKIRKVLLSQSIVELENGIQIPLSKSYKPVLKEYRKNAGI